MTLTCSPETQYGGSFACRMSGGGNLLVSVRSKRLVAFSSAVIISAEIKLIEFLVAVIKLRG